MSQSAEVTPRPRRRRPRAGKRLRADLDAALEHAGRELGGQILEWSEAERLTIDRAAAAADRAEELRWLYDDELIGERRATVLVKLSGELRLCEKQVVDMVGRVTIGVAAGVQKSQRHAYSANARWHQGGA